jgi:hypothetical protein
MTSHPHRDQPVLAAGRKLSEAAGAVILVHGRGASAENILISDRNLIIRSLPILLHKLREIVGIRIHSLRQSSRTNHG